MTLPNAPHNSFQTTCWSLVARAASSNDQVAMAALTTLCERYWYPIYAYIRRTGANPHDAEDLTQGFFAWVLAKEMLGRADAAKGRLRNFLLTCVQRYLSDERDKMMAEKRGAFRLTSFDAAEAEERYTMEPRDNLSPDRLFQRRWALTILDRGLTLLGEEYHRQGKTEIFVALRPFLGFGPDPEKLYEEVAAQLKMPLGTLKNHVFRMRERWRELIFEQVAVTLTEATPTEIKGELAELLACV